jgi:hypothetical protein
MPHSLSILPAELRNSELVESTLVLLGFAILSVAYEQTFKLAAVSPSIPRKAIVEQQQQLDHHEHSNTNCKAFPKVHQRMQHSLLMLYGVGSCMDSRACSSACLNHSICLNWWAAAQLAPKAPFA